MRRTDALPRSRAAATWRERAARREDARLASLLERLDAGRLEITFPDGRAHCVQGTREGPRARVTLHDRRLLRRVAFGGEIAFGEAYVDGWWDADDPAALIELLHRNPRLFDAPAAYGGLVPRLVHRGLERLRRNTRAGSRRNVRSHYDLGDDLFAAFLDESMSYSCAIWDGDDDTLERAQRRKIDALLDLLDMARPGTGQRMLEIGCGWGALAAEAARRTGCRVDAITLSRNQRVAAERRARDAGVAGLVDVAERDYRGVRGTYDRIVSVEMIEAVGHENLPRFFAVCDRALAPGGRVVLQAITVPDDRYEAYRRGSDWLRKHVFPGGLAPSIAALRDAMRRASGLEIVSLHRIGPHYARTLRAWRDRFEAAWPALAGPRYDERFRRLWSYYLAYCEGGFAAGTFDDVLIVLERGAGARR